MHPRVFRVPRMPEEPTFLLPIGDALYAYKFSQVLSLGLENFAKLNLQELTNNSRGVNSRRLMRCDFFTVYARIAIEPTCMIAYYSNSPMFP